MKNLLKKILYIILILLSGCAGSAGYRKMSDLTAAEITKGIRIGWNLGNSFDAEGGETGWGNPPVTEELIQTVSGLGFGAVRIPVTWSLHFGPEPDYLIDPEWIIRVEEVVRYVIDNGMYAIINMHHDGADGYEAVEWITLNDNDGAVTEENNKKVMDQFTKIWTQVAEHFRNYNEKLIFESMNEIHDGYGLPKPAYYDIVNNLNQAFVDTVRTSGGNNEKRTLIVPGYNTNINYTVKGFKLPQDTIQNRLILSVHYYDPWNFSSGQTKVWGKGYSGNDGWGQEKYVRDEFDRLKKTFSDKGIPVIIGEYGAVHLDGSENYRRYYLEYVTKAAYDRGITVFYWDNGGIGSGNDKFGLIDRNTNEVIHADITDAIIKAVNSGYSLEDVELPE